MAKAEISIDLGSYRECIILPIARLDYKQIGEIEASLSEDTRKTVNKNSEFMSFDISSKDEMKAAVEIFKKYCSDKKYQLLRKVKILVKNTENKPNKIGLIIDTFYKKLMFLGGNEFDSGVRSKNKKILLREFKVSEKEEKNYSEFEIVFKTFFKIGYFVEVANIEKEPGVFIPLTEYKRVEISANVGADKQNPLKIKSVGGEICGDIDAVFSKVYGAPYGKNEEMFNIFASSFGYEIEYRGGDKGHSPKVEATVENENQTSEDDEVLVYDSEYESEEAEAEMETEEASV